MARLKLLFVMAAVAAARAATGSQGLFLDTSGSMIGFHSSGVVRSLAQPLYSAMASEGGVQVYGFSEQVRQYKTLEDITPKAVGGFTDIGKTVEQASKDKLRLFWIITDNLEHREGSKEGEGTEQFYAMLRGESVKRVTVFPVVVGGGRPGLVVYAILLDEGADAIYGRGIASFEKGASGLLRTDALRMKPLDRGVVSTQVTSRAEDGQPAAVVYETGKPITRKVIVRFHSSLPHIAIVDSQVDFLERQPQFQKASLLLAEHKTTYINPTKIDNLPGGGSTDQQYEIVVELSRLRLKPGLGTLWKAAFGKSSEEARLDLALLIKVPRTNFRLHPEFLSRFNAPTPADARETGRVFALDRLPTLMNESVTAVEVHQELVFPVKYPFYPTVIWLVVGGLLVALVVGLVRWLPRLLPASSGQWLVSVEGEPGTEAAIRRGTVLVDGDEVGRVEKDAFHPAAEVDPDGGGAPVPLKSGVVAPIRVRRRQVRLKFEEKGGPKRRKTAEPAETHRR